MILWDNFHVKVVKKAEICEKLLKMLKKCGFGCPDDVIGPKLGKFIEKKIVLEYSHVYFEQSPPWFYGVIFILKGSKS